MSLRRTEVRTARKQHRCGVVGWSSHCRTIQPGERYLVHTLSPGDSEVDNVTWLRANECSDCAERYGRGDLLAAPSQPEGNEGP